MPCEDSGTLREARIDCASMIAALGSSLRPAAGAHLAAQRVMDHLGGAVGLHLA